MGGEVPLRVLLVTGEYPPMRGGVGDYSALLAAGLHAEGVAVRVLTSTKAAPRDDRVVPPVAAEVARWDFGCWPALGDAIDRFQPAIVHLQYQAGAFDLHGAIPLWPLVLRLRRNRPRSVVTFHDLLVPYLFPKAGPLRRLAIRLLAATADRVVATNAEDAAQLRWLGNRVRWIPIGSNIPMTPATLDDRAAIRARFGVAADELLLGYFGFLTPTKGVETLLDALRRLDASGVRAKLLMIGGSSGESAASDRSYDRTIRALTEAPDLRDWVQWTGFATTVEISRALQAVDLCVLPFREGATLRHGTLVAALVHGLPIVTTPPPTGWEKAATHNGAPPVELVPPDDPATLADAIARLAADPAGRAALAAAARSLGDLFRWDRIVAETIELYQQLADWAPT